MSSLFQRLIEDSSIAVAPSMLSADFSCLEREIRAVEEAGADCLHLDIMDGNFVPNLTFGPMIVSAIAKLSSLPLITHLMIRDPLRFIDAFVDAGSYAVSFHWEAIPLGHEKIISAIKARGAKAGIALNPATPLSSVRDMLASVDFLLVMTVVPGFGGQCFIPDALEKAVEASRIRKEKGLKFVIEVDGGVKPENAALVRASGAQILVAGTAVFKSGNYSRAIAAIRGG